jgi:biopolymer transport protein ExbD
VIKAATEKPPQQGPELTALIDIIFIVVVFLLLTANTPLLQLTVDPPQTDEQLVTPTTRPSITIGLDSANTWRINDNTFTDWESFRAGIHAIEDRNQVVMISADRGADVEPLLQLLALLNTLQFSNTQILMEHSQP